jgi:hypothetical protein
MFALTPRQIGSDFVHHGSIAYRAQRLAVARTRLPPWACAAHTPRAGAPAGFRASAEIAGLRRTRPAMQAPMTASLLKMTVTRSGRDSQVDWSKSQECRLELALGGAFEERDDARHAAVDACVAEDGADRKCDGVG